MDMTRATFLVAAALVVALAVAAAGIGAYIAVRQNAPASNVTLEQAAPETRVAAALHGIRPPGGRRRSAIGTGNRRCVHGASPGADGSRRRTAGPGGSAVPAVSRFGASTGTGTATRRAAGNCRRAAARSSAPGAVQDVATGSGKKRAADSAARSGARAAGSGAGRRACTGAGRNTAPTAGDCASRGSRGRGLEAGGSRTVEWEPAGSSGCRSRLAACGAR